MQPWPVRQTTGQGPTKQRWTTPKHGFKVPIKKIIGGGFAAESLLGNMSTLQNL
jgi:hypothetical protein